MGGSPNSPAREGVRAPKGNGEGGIWPSEVPYMEDAQKPAAEPDSDIKLAEGLGKTVQDDFDTASKRPSVRASLTIASRGEPVNGHYDPSMALPKAGSANPDAPGTLRPKLRLSSRSDSPPAMKRHSALEHDEDEGEIWEDDDEAGSTQEVASPTTTPRLVPAHIAVRKGTAAADALAMIEGKSSSMHDSGISLMFLSFTEDQLREMCAELQIPSHGG